ncbi:MAG: hypothetical protein ACLR9D_06575 [Phocaeicola vulgatus]
MAYLTFLKKGTRKFANYTRRSIHTCLLGEDNTESSEGTDSTETTGEAGGICLTPQAAKEEIDGTDHPVEVFTPASWGRTTPKAPEGTDSTETTGEGGAS